jgi:hypothetical protein
MSTIELLEKLKKHADEYSQDAQASTARNRHMNNLEHGELIQKRHTDAVIVDFINHIAMKHGVDFGLYTDDLGKIKF